MNEKELDENNATNHPSSDTHYPDAGLENETLVLNDSPSVSSVTGNLSITY